MIEPRPWYTPGGWIVLGVTQDGERFEVSGVDEPDGVQNDFLSVLHAGQKIISCGPSTRSASSARAVRGGNRKRDGLDIKLIPRSVLEDEV